MREYALQGMCVYVHVCVCALACVCVCVHVCVYVCVRVHVCVFMGVYMDVYELQPPPSSPEPSVPWHVAIAAAPFRSC